MLISKFASLLLSLLLPLLQFGAQRGPLDTHGTALRQRRLMTEAEEDEFEDSFDDYELTQYTTRSGRKTTVAAKMTEKTTYVLTNEQFMTLLSRLSPAADKEGSFTTCKYTYDGKKSRELVEAFLTAVNLFKRKEKIIDATALEEISLLLKEDAGIWWQGIREDVKTWADFETRLRDNFASVREPYLIFMDITQFKHEAGISTEEFVRQKRLLFSQLPAPKFSETTQLDMIYGLLNINIRDKVSRSSVKNFDELIKAAVAVEHVIYEKAATDNQENAEKSTSKFDGRRGPSKKRCRYCKNVGHLIEDCKKRQYNESKLNKSPVTVDPPRKSFEANVQFPSQPTPKFSCYGCGAPGVVRTNCPNCHKSKSRPSTTQQTALSAIDATTIDARDRPMIVIDVEGSKASAYIDTCAKSSIASHELYGHLKEKGYRFTDLEVGITFADGNKKKQIVLITTAPVKLNERVIVTKFLVLPESYKARTLLGVGFIQDALIQLNLPQLTYSFVDDPLTEYELYNEGFVNFEGDVKLSPLKVEVNTEPALPKGSVTAMASRPYKLKRIDFPTPPQKKPCAKLFDGYSPVMDALYEDAKNTLKDYDPYSSETEFASVEVSTLEHFLERNSEVFIPNGNPANGFEHEIDTGDHKPISVAPYRLSPLKQDALKVEISKMLQESVIEPCSSPWAAPVVMVPKKDGGIRVCVDYRQLNAVTVPDAYPLPRIDDLIHNAKPTPCMSTVDLRAGYWQISVKETDRCKTAFVTPFGMYQFKRMPFGLRNAPATFQRMMDRFRIQLSHIKLLVYLDDLIVMSTIYEQHLKDLQDVFDKLREFNLTAKKEKCHFCCSKVKYLGHLITPKGLEVDPEKVDCILKMTPPRNLKHLMSYVQLCSWYRRFIPNFAKIVEPLTRLTKKNATWRWEEEQTQAFEQLRKLMSSPPILAQADEMKPFIIKTDASSYAIGAVLVQGEGAKEHPVEFASRLLTQAERNYSTTEREALAVVWAVEKFRGYIEGNKVIVQTDHQALKWLMSLKTPTGRLARWALRLQPFDITIKYITGRTNVVADCLSRPSCDQETENECGICSVVVDMPKKPKEEVRTEQLKDEDIASIVIDLEGKSTEKAQYWSHKGYVINNGLLYRYDPLGTSEEAQIVVPKQEQLKVIQIYHEEATAGHYGAEKTIARIAQRYYWKGMRGQVEAYVRKCLDCQRYKPSNQKPAGLLQTTSSNQRFEVVAFDLFGPLPRTNSNHNWIFVVEDVATRWIELFALEQATAEECARVLLNEIILRYGTPRRFISDNGTQFVSGVMQQLTYCLNIRHGFIPVYHPETNPVERRNRDLKTQLAILVEGDHTCWVDKLPSIRFAMNSVQSSATGFSPAYLTFGRELRTPDDVEHDFRDIIQDENFVTGITQRLKTMATTLKRAREVQEMKEEKRKEYMDQKRKECPDYQPGDLILVDTHTLSSTSHGYTSKFAPRRDGPYVILQRHGPSSFQVAHADTKAIVGTYHASALRPYKHTENAVLPTPANPIRRRGRPRKPKRAIENVKSPRGRPPKNRE